MRPWPIAGSRLFKIKPAFPRLSLVGLTAAGKAIDIPSSLLLLPPPCSIKDIPYCLLLPFQAPLFPLVPALGLSCPLLFPDHCSPDQLNLPPTLFSHTNRPPAPICSGLLSSFGASFSRQFSLSVTHTFVPKIHEPCQSARELDITTFAVKLAGTIRCMTFHFPLCRATIYGHSADVRSRGDRRDGLSVEIDTVFR